MNSHNITASNYMDAFVLVLAKRGSDILADWMGVGKEVRINMFSNPVYAKATQHLHIWHMSTGVVGEVLEFYEALHQGIEGTEREEIADALFYLIGMSKYVGIDWLEFIDQDLKQSGLVCEPDTYLMKAMRLDDMCKKYNVYNDESKLVDIQNAWIDFAHVWVGIASKFFTSLQDVIDENVVKLSERYAGIVYSNESAIKRADKLDDFPSGT